MILNSVEIFDFKSIKHEDIKVNGNQLCFVGKNECGKSSIIQAISHLNFLDYEMSSSLINKSSQNYPNGFPVIAGVFKLNNQSENKLFHLLENQIRDNKVNERIRTEHEDLFVQVKRWGNGVSNLSIILTDTETFAFDILEFCENKAQFADDFYNQIYPSIQY